MPTGRKVTYDEKKERAVIISVLSGIGMVETGERYGLPLHTVSHIMKSNGYEKRWVKRIDDYASTVS